MVRPLRLKEPRSDPASHECCMPLFLLSLRVIYFGCWFGLNWPVRCGPSVAILEHRGLAMVCVLGFLEGVGYLAALEYGLGMGNGSRGPWKGCGILVLVLRFVSGYSGEIHGAGRIVYLTRLPTSSVWNSFIYESWFLINFVLYALRFKLLPRAGLDLSRHGDWQGLNIFESIIYI
jgi:hypothetical protein